MEGSGKKSGVKNCCVDVVEDAIETLGRGGANALTDVARNRRLIPCNIDCSFNFIFFSGLSYTVLGIPTKDGAKSDLLRKN